MQTRSALTSVQMLRTRAACCRGQSKGTDMGIHEPIERGDSDDRLPQRYVEMCVATWTKYRQPADVLGPAMLAVAINLMIEHADDPGEVAHILVGIAAQLSPAQEAGHA
jgi:hypothetical protein